MGLAEALGLAGMGIGSAISGVAGAISASQAAKAQQKAAREARGQIEQYTNKAVGYQQPYYDIGTQNLQNVSAQNAAGQFDAAPYQQQQFNFEADPGYKWRLNQGMDAINSNAAAQGQSLSGATMKALISECL
jgi:hypothetical protein